MAETGSIHPEGALALATSPARGDSMLADTRPPEQAGGPLDRRPPALMEAVRYRNLRSTSDQLSIAGADRRRRFSAGRSDGPAIPAPHSRATIASRPPPGQFDRP